MASLHLITWILLVSLLVGGFVTGQDQESQEEVDEGIVVLGLSQILGLKPQGRPVAPVGRGDVEGSEAKAAEQAAEQTSEQSEAGADAAESAAEAAEDAAEAAAEAAEDAAEAAGEGAEAGSEGSETGNEGAGLPPGTPIIDAEAEQEAAEQAAEQTSEQSEAAEDAAEAAAEAAEDAAEAAEDAAEAAEEAAEDAAEAGSEGSEAGGEGAGLPPGTPVIGAGKDNKPDSPFFAVGGAQMGGGVEALGGDAGESAEETQDGGIVGEQAAGGTTDSSEEGSVVGQQGTVDAESTEEADAVDPAGSLISVQLSDTNAEDSYLPSSVSFGEEEEGAPVEGSVMETEQDTAGFKKPNLAAGPLFDQAKQVSGTTPKAVPTPKPTEPATEKPEDGGGLSDSYKRRIAISGASVGAIVLVGLIAFGVGRRVTRRR